MSKIFLNIINMSISSGYIVIVVLFLRLLFKKAPKWITVVLWGIVAIRMVCPISLESVFSLIPSSETISPYIMTEQTPAIHSGIPIINYTLNPIISESFSPGPGDSANPLQIWIPILTAIWIVGMVALLIYTAISYIRIRRKTGNAVILRDNVYQSENVASPFVLGLFRPKIYLPFNINDKDIEHVVAHEQAHICRKDHLWKPLGFLLLTIHWFNPLIWLGYILLCRDIELACDEKVIKKLDRDARADYSEALLCCSINRRIIAACPLAFGEVSVKKRVKSVLSYKKPTFWIIIVALVACLISACCFLTNPINKDNIGVNKISAKSVDTDTVELKIKYSYPTGGYSIRCVSEDEGEYCGDGIIDYDGSLGKYRILVEFGDTEPSKEWKKTYPAGETVELETSPIKIRLKYVYPEDHGFALYLGFDTPVSVDPVDYGKLKTFGGSLKIPINVSQKNLIYDNLIYGVIPPAGDSDKLSYIYVQDFGCDVENVKVNFEKARIENEQIYFDILWQNNTSDYISIGPDFQVYKYEGSSLVKLESIGYWTLELLILSGKSGDFPNERSQSYNLSSHFDVSEPGKYRFESNGAWVDFQIVGNFSVISAVYDSATFDIDGDSVAENCSMRYGHTSGLFTFIFLVQDKKSGVKYETTFLSDVYDLSFKKCADGVMRVQAITRDETPETHLFDISINDGNINLTENGIPIGEIG